MAVGDFNGDGKLDLAVTDNSDVSILLGNGDGSFQPAQSYAAAAFGSVAVGDFNGRWLSRCGCGQRDRRGHRAAECRGLVAGCLLGVNAPAVASAGTPFAVTVTALDQYGQVVENYTGTVSFSSSDPYPGVLPADYTFTPSDHGSHTFAGVTLFTAGTQMLTVQDTANTALTGSAAISVTPAAASHFFLNAPAMVISGTPFDVTVTALDPYGNVDTNYAGTVTWSSTDSDPGSCSFRITPSKHRTPGRTPSRTALR